DEPHTLGELIDEQIRQSGPMRVDEYMRLCLTHPTLGYYRRARPFGREGDFVTAPDISQMFGEMIGVWAAALSADFAEGVELVELGPGRGTLMADLLR